MFMEVLADAVSKTDGFGLGKMLEKSLTPPGAKSAPGAPAPLGQRPPEAPQAAQ